MDYEDSFTGLWQCNLRQSQLPMAPRSWVQRITVRGEAIDVQENIVNQDGTTTQVRVQANFDGMEHPVTGSVLADSIAYTRQENVISGTARKSGAVSLQETIRAEGTRMVADLVIFAAGKQIATGVAVFDRIDPSIAPLGRSE